jgi:hypothetical protein
LPRLSRVRVRRLSAEYLTHDHPPNLRRSE